MGVPIASNGDSAHGDGDSRSMTDIDIPTATGPLPVYLAVPTTTAPWPAVIVIHDGLGMSNDLRRQADWLAGSGYLAVAPDLYRGGHKLRCMFAAIRDIRARGAAPSTSTPSGPG